MPKITLHLNEAQIRSEVSEILTSGMVGVEVDLVCDASWEGLHKTLVCRTGDIAKTVLVQDDQAVVAHEALVAGKWLELGVEGRNDDGTVVIPTLWERCCIVLPGADVDADPTADPTLPVWKQLQKRVEALEIPRVPVEIGALPGPLAAKVGQHFQVAEVNKIGMVVAVEAVDMPTGGENYELPAATADALGGIKADPATEGDTQPVRIGEDGKLYTAPGGATGNGESSARSWSLLRDVKTEEAVQSIEVTMPVPQKHILVKLFVPGVDTATTAYTSTYANGKALTYYYGADIPNKMARGYNFELEYLSDGIWKYSPYIYGNSNMTEDAFMVFNTKLGANPIIGAIGDDASITEILNIAFKQSGSGDGTSYPAGTRLRVWGC